MKTSKTYLKLLAGVALAAMAGFVGTASATQTINVNFGSEAADAMNGKAFINNNYQQAPAIYTGTNWNDHVTTTNVNGTITKTNLLDSDGTTTAVGYTTIPTSTGFNLIGPLSWGGQPNVKMLNGSIYRAFNSGSGNTMHNRFTVTGLDTNKTYHVYVATSREVNVKCSWGIGTNTVVTTNTLQFVTNTTPTRVGETWAPKDNWVVFYSVAPSAEGKIFVWGQGLAGGDGGVFQGISLNGFQVVDATGWLNADKGIYKFGNETAVSSSVVSNNGTGTNITWTVLYSTVLTALSPTFTLADFATASPVSGTTLNFSTPQNYTVTAQDGSTKIYRVTAVNAPASPAKDILTLTQGANSSVITGTNVYLYVPAGTVVTALNPTVTVSPFATVSPLSGATNDFTTPINYTVTAENGTTKTYVVSVVQANLWTNSAGGVWTTAANWNPNAVPTSSATTALGFNTAGTYTSTHDLGDGFQLNQIAFGAPVLTLAGQSLQFTGTAPAMFQNSAATVTIGNGLDLAANTALAGTGAGAVTLNGAVSGVGTLTKSTSGTLTLNGVGNSFSGITVSSGSLTIGAQTALGSGTVTLAGGTTFQQTTFEGNGVGGALANPFDLSGGIVTINAPFSPFKDIWLAGVVSGPGGFFIQGGTRSLTLTAANTFSGGVTVTSGNNVQVYNVDGLGTGALSINNAGSVARLLYVGDHTVTALSFDGVAQAIGGTYGATASGAEIIDNVRFTGTGTVTVGTHNQARLRTFVFPGLPATTINQTNLTVSVTVPFSTDVTILAPTNRVSTGGTSTPASETTLDFTTPQAYTIISGDGTATNVYTVTVTKAPDSNAKAILTFGPGAVITGTNIAWTVLYSANITTLSPTYTVSPQASGVPASGTTLDFTSPQNYTITAENFSTTNYLVTVTVAPPSSAKDILTFGPGAVITGTNIVWVVPNGTDVTILAPTYTVSPFASGAPASAATVDFTTPQLYTVTAEDSSTKIYLVTVTLTPPPWVNVNIDTAERINLTGPVGGLGTTWNQTNQTGMTALLDAAGAATTVGFSTTAGGVDVWNVASPLTMLTAAALNFGQNTPSDLRLTGLPTGRKYDLYIASYYPNEAGGKSQFTTTNVTTTVGTQFCDNAGGNAGGGNQSTWAQGANFVRFANMQPSPAGNITVTYISGDNAFRSMVNGFQLVDIGPVAAPAPIPTLTGMTGPVVGVFTINGSTDIAGNVVTLTTPSLSAPVTWTPLQTNAVPGGAFSFTVPQGAGPTKFYRLLGQ